MIVMVEDKKSQDKLLELCSKSAFGCKTHAAALSYGFNRKFAYFWLDKNESAAYSLVDDVMVISGTLAEPKEVNSFVRAVGANSLICAVRNAEALGISKDEIGDVLRKNLEGEPPEIKPEEINIREVIFLLEDMGMVEDFESFYLDLSHRIRHRTAFVETHYENDELVGCAVVSAVTPISAVISAVAVRDEYRRQGIGTKLIENAEKKLSGRTIYIFKDKDRNLEFYKQLGYIKTDTWVSSKLN